MLGTVIEDVLDPIAIIDDGTDGTDSHDSVDGIDAVSDCTIEPDMEWWGALGWCSCMRCPAGVPIRGVPSLAGNIVCGGSMVGVGSTS